MIREPWIRAVSCGCTAFGPSLDALKVALPPPLISVVTAPAAVLITSNVSPPPSPSMVNAFSPK